MVKANPMIANDRERLESELKRSSSILRNVVFQSLPLLTFGIFIASAIILAESREVVLGLLGSLAFIPLILSIYQTAVQATYLNSLGVFDNLKMMPTRLGGHYLSGVIALDLIPNFAFVLPSVVILLIQKPLVGTLTLLWFLLGIILGHVIGLAIFTTFGLKIQSYKGRYNFLKVIVKVIALIVVLTLFFSLIYAYEYIIPYMGFMTELSVIYPMAITSVFDPFFSIFLLILHSIFLLLIYYYISHKIWERILEPIITSDRRIQNEYFPSTRSKMSSLVLKDLKMISRQTAMIAGFLLPLFVLIPQIVLAVQEGDLSLTQITFFIFIVGALTLSGSDAVLKIEGKNLDFLRTLPLTKDQYIIGKAVTMSLIPMILSIILVVFGIYYYISAILLLPLAFLLPLTSSFFTMIYLFRYEEEDIGIPDINILKMIVLFIIVGLLFGLIAVPILLLNTYIGYFTSYGIASILMISAYLHLKL